MTKFDARMLPGVPGWSPYFLWGMTWKKGRGKLGSLAPLLGSWTATADSPMGRVRCVREFKPVLGGKYVQLICTWRFAKGSYEEIALFGVDDGVLTFWS